MLNLKKIILFVSKEINEIIYSIKNNSRIIFKVAVILILSTLTIGVMMKIPKLSFIGGNSESWLQYWGGLIGAMLGIYGSFIVMQHQFKLERRKTEEHNKPLIVPNSITFSKVRFPNTDGETPQMREYEKFLYIPVFNVGESSIFDIEHTIELININEIIDKLSSYEIKALNEGSEFNFSIVDSLFFERSHKTLQIYYQSEYLESIRSNLTISAQTWKYPMLKSGESFELFFDKYGIWLILVMSLSGLLYEVKPVFKITMQFLDSKFQNKVIEFLVNIEDVMTHGSLVQLKYPSDRLVSQHHVSFTVKPDFISVKQQLEQQ